MKQYSLVVDQSTSGTKVLLYDGVEFKRVDKKHTQYYPKPGWVEHDPMEIYQNVIELIETVLQSHGLTYGDVNSLSITNQRETIIAWDKTTGIPIYNALVWQCNRAMDICDHLVTLGKETMIRKKTGLNIDTYFSGPKIKWLSENISEYKIQKSASNVCIGTVDTWLIWKLTEGQHFSTDESNASRTMLYNIKTNCWDEELLELFDVDSTSLPRVQASDAFFGSYKGIPIRGVIADSQSSLYANDCVAVGSAKATLGTGCSIMVNASQRETSIVPTLVETIAWKKDDTTHYAIEGVIRSMGDTLEWTKNELGLIEDVKNINSDSLSSNGVIFIPAQLGLATPYWNTKIKASFTGMVRSTTQQDLVNAIYSSLIFQVKDVIDEINNNTTTKVLSLNVDGGISKNEPFIQHLTNLLGFPVHVSEDEELSAIGALKIAGYSYTTRNRTFTPKPNSQHLSEFIEWKKTIKNIIELEKKHD